MTTTLVGAASAGRYDLYGPIHKGLRRAHAEMLTRLGSADFASDRAGVLADLRAHLTLAEVHLMDEEAVIHAALEMRLPGGAAKLDHQHADHRASFAMLEVAIRAVEGSESHAAAIANGRQLYILFSRFVADDLEHMAEEECETWPLLCALFSDTELHELERAIVAGLDPQINMMFLRHVIPASTHAERAALLGGMKAGAPSHVYAAVIEQVVMPSLPAHERGQLAMMGLIA